MHPDTVFLSTAGVQFTGFYRFSYVNMQETNSLRGFGSHGEKQMSQSHF